MLGHEEAGEQCVGAEPRGVVPMTPTDPTHPTHETHETHPAHPIHATQRPETPLFARVGDVEAYDHPAGVVREARAEN